MKNTNHLDEIQELNLAYLLLAQRLLNDDRAAAMFRLKIDGETADLLSS
ncbi:MAG: flagellar transcriptional regulator FlhD, partial [Billgrantia desiderata]